MKPLLFFLLTLWLTLAGTVTAAEETWIAARSRAQLAMDPILIPKGKGLLFVPAMTHGLREPKYQIFQNGNELATHQAGHGLLLTPGVYDLVIGSGAISQMMRREVEIVENMTTLIKPWWASLVINVIDETRTAIKQSYELFDANQENYGIGFGVEEERGEAVDTWLLEPGTYTIVKVGESLAVPRRFSVRLLPGELVQRNLAIDQDGNFVGFYTPGYLQLSSQTAARWNSRWELSMSTLFNTTQNTAGEDRTSLSFSGQIRNRSRYSTERHFFDLRLVLEQGFTKESGQLLRKSIDDLELRSTYIFRLTPHLGTYLRGVVNSKLFPTEVRFDTPQDLIVLARDGQQVEILSNITSFTQEPSFFPIQLRQGLGINSQLIRTFPLNLDVRLGLGARQTYVTDSFQLSDDLQTARELKNAASTGLEALLIMDARLGRYLSLDSEFDLLIPSSKIDDWEFSIENRLRTFLTPFINMDILFDFEKQKPLARLQSRQQVLLRLVKFF